MWTEMDGLNLDEIRQTKLSQIFNLIFGLNNDRLAWFGLKQ